MTGSKTELVANSTETNGLCSSFLFEDHNVRVQEVENGDILFVAKDVAEALGISWSNQTLSKIPNEWTCIMKLIMESGAKKVTFITEPAVYKLAFRSNKESAERFTNWVASQVLPSIRKTGSYAVNQESSSPDMKSVVGNVKTSYELAKPYHGMAKLLGCTKSTASSLTAQFVKRTTGMDVSGLLIENVATVQDPLVTVTEIGHELGFPGRCGNRINKVLQCFGLQNHVEYKSGIGKLRKKWELTDTGKEFAQILDTGKKHSDGVPIQQVKWYKNKTLSFIHTRKEQLIA